MIVLAESNFVLEIAFQQEQAAEAQHVADLAEARRLELIVPACCFAEPYQTLIRRQRERKVLSKNLQDELRQLGRSRAFAARGSAWQELAQTLAAGDESEAKGLENTIQSLTGFCTVAPLTRQVIRDAQQVQAEFDLDPHDALVFASIDAVLRERDQAPKVFINKNSKDFATPQIEEHLRRYNCRLFTNFADARQFIEHTLGHGTAGRR
jgi:hypothetical protein